jgi:hypothetical protein
MDKSKMAKAGTKIKYDLYKENWGQDGMSREVHQRSQFGGCCCDCDCGDKCKCEKSLDDTLNPPKPDKYGPVCR